MKWSSSLRTLSRGVQLVTRIARAKRDKPKPRAVRPHREASRMLEFSGFGDNPGQLQARAYVPASVSGGPLLVLLHGCDQDAAGFAEDSGWMDVADRLNVPLLLPEQAKANNPKRCFQWFRPADVRRGSGEAASIAAMTQGAIGRFGSDPRRIFVVGLSAGGAMAAALLAAYPDVFAGGAAVAGLPVGAARSGMQAILRMASAGPKQSPESWAEQARAVAPVGFAGPWPRLSIWQGQLDKTVAPENGLLLATQWCALHDLTGLASDEHVRAGVTHRTWPAGARPLVELWSLPDVGHAYPAGAREIVPGGFVEQASIDATAEIERFFGLD